MKCIELLNRYIYKYCKCQSSEIIPSQTTSMFRIIHCIVFSLNTSFNMKSYVSMYNSKYRCNV